MGARFAKWRAVIRIADALPSAACVRANAHALARYAALCQEGALVPIVEPEVLMDGSHSLERCEEVTSMVLHAVFQALFEQRISLEAMLLKPNMVIAGKDCPEPASVQEVASGTLRCLRRHVPAAVPGVVFLSGGQSDHIATAHLNAINRLPGPKPWKISFSYGRALQDSALEAWHGRDENLKTAQEACRTGPGATEPPVSAGTPMKWRRARPAPPNAMGCTTTDRNDLPGAFARRSPHAKTPFESSGGHHGKPALGQGTRAHGCVLARRQLPVGRPDLSL
jgi:hypothetical protein